MSITTKGYICAAIAAATYGMNPLFTLPLYADGMDPNSVLLFRYIFAILIVGFMIKTRGRSFKIQRSEVAPLAVMGILAAYSSLALFISYHYMAAGIASTILFVYPIMVAILMAVLFKERLTLQTIACIALALTGISLLYKTKDGDTLSTTGIVFVLSSALSYALYIVGVNRPRLKNIATVKLTFYVFTFGALLFVAGTNFCQDVILPTKWYLWGFLIALGLFPTAISFFCTTIAAQYIGATPTAILGALEPVTAIAFGVLLFNEDFTPRIALGVILIILAVTIIIAGGKITAPLTRFRKLFPKLKRR